VIFGFRSEPIDFDYRDLASQKPILGEHCAGLGWEAPRLLKANDGASDFYFDELAQVHMDRWSAGRVVLLGDAGYCPSPGSGQGTSLALVGSWVLADALEDSPDHVRAFDR
jgi:2-polyprenyl-6-methoxyphenol hydroxylase-like FAD-dependent oxidoreductase